MAVISMDYNDLIALIGKDIPLEEIVDRLPMIGSDIDSIEGDQLNIEFFPNRPDLYSVEGVARALRGFFGLERGLVEYPVSSSGMVLEVDPSVEEVRPYIVAAFIQNVQMDDALIRSLMEIQEKLHLTMGRKRKKLAIGVHDFKELKPPFTYKAVAPKEIKFIPLGHFKELDLAEILEKHEKGQEYAWILEGKDKYPIIQDSEGKVLSFPPIINGTYTTVTEKTENIFLDMTGTDLKTLKTALNIIATMLAERGGQIKTVEVRYKDETLTLPDLAPGEREITPEYANRILGIGLTSQDIVKHLEAMRFGASIVEGDEGDDGGDGNRKEGTVRVLVPAYRNDIIHTVDLVEDIAIAHGFENFKGRLPTNLTFAKERKIEAYSNVLRDLMTGYGHQETMGLIISSEKKQFTLLQRDTPENLTVILNPINEELTCARQSIYPSLLEVLSVNRHRDLPQSIFEVGNVVIGHKNYRYLGAMTIHPKASYSGIKSLIQSLLRDLDIEFSIEAHDDPAYIEGRAARIMVEGEMVGHFGEIHPQVITNFELGCPIAGYELFVDELLD